MANNLFSDLIKTTIPILNEDNKIISYAFIFEFTIPDNPSKVIPFLIMNYLDIKDVKEAKLLFSTTENSINNAYYVVFDNKFVNEMRLSDYVVYPVAGLINESKNHGKALNYIGINEKWVIDLENPKTRSLETLSYINFEKIYNETEYTPCIGRTYNCTPFYNGQNDYFLIKYNESNALGFPVFLAEEGSFYSGEGLCLGTRVIFTGIAFKSVNNKIVVQYPSYLMQEIKEKYKKLFEGAQAEKDDTK